MARRWGSSVLAITAAIAVVACTGTPSPAPTERPTPTPVAVPALSPTPRPTGLFVGGFAQITVAELDVRTEPSIDAPLMYVGQADAPATPVRWGKQSGVDRVFILGGPVDADGYRWWRVSPTVYELDGVRRPAPGAPYPEEIGWVGDDGDNAWLEPADECPAPPVELADITFLVASWAVRLGCFQGQVLTLRGWLSTLPPEDAESSAPPVAGPAIFPVKMGWYDQGNVNRLDFRLHPAMSVQLPSPEQWVDVTGSFDVPTATQCEPFEVLECRSTLTVTSIRPLGP